MDVKEVLSGSLRPSPEDAKGLVLHRFGAEDDSAPPIRFFIYHDVLRELVYASGYRRDVVFAVLTGGFGLQESGGFIEVTGFDGLDYVRRTGELYDEVRPACDAFIGGQRDSDDAIVGLFVGQHGGEGRLDREVARCHLSLFNVPFQVVLSLDVDEGKFGVYARPPGQEFMSVPFTVVTVRGESVELERGSDVVDDAEAIRDVRPVEEKTEDAENYIGEEPNLTGMEVTDSPDDVDEDAADLSSLDDERDERHLLGMTVDESDEAADEQKTD